ncbi:unnamed protein product, partial [marine sediment metagenome]
LEIYFNIIIKIYYNRISNSLKISNNIKWGLILKRIMHLITRWNPFYNEEEKWEYWAVKKTCKILEKYIDDEKNQYTWWGKISKSGNLGIDESIVDIINNQIKSDIETHLYLYCPDISYLHVGKLEEITTLNKKNDKHAPSFYKRIPYEVPFWFKLSDIRYLNFNDFFWSQILYEKDGKLRPRLAVTIACASQKEREKIIPHSKIYKLDSLMSACKQFQEETGDKIIFEYPLIYNINDSIEKLDEFSNLIKDFNCDVHIIPFNEFKGSNFRRPPDEK